MHLKGQGPKLGWLKIFVNKVGFTHLCQKLSKWRSAPNFTECPLCFLGVPMDPCKHTRRWILARAKWLNYWGKTHLKTYDLIFLSFLVKELRQTESTKMVIFHGLSFRTTFVTISQKVRNFYYRGNTNHKSNYDNMAARSRESLDEILVDNLLFINQS